MRKYIDIIENNSSETVRLYRGDSSNIPVFSKEKTRSSIGLLFGVGIYLTDNQDVAKDYTISNRSANYLKKPASSKRAAIVNYPGSIIDDELDWKNKKQEFITKLSNEYYSIPKDERPDYNEYFDMKKIFDELQQYIDKAKDIFRSRSKSMRIVSNTSGEWQILKDDHSGSLSVFDIPERYLAKTFHGDMSMTDKELSVVREFIGDQGGFRNNNNEGVSFDEWLRLYNKEGVPYAWRTSIHSGLGNPPLDLVWNGTYVGESLFRNKIDDFIKLAQSHGFVGIRYNGGVKIGELTRGLGGVSHTSYCFWDDDYINSCRTEVSDPNYEYHPIPNISKLKFTNWEN